MLTITRPTLLLNEKQCKANIRKMVDKAKRLNADLVPHFKTHQSSEIGEWFRAFGIESITVSSVKMAEYFAQEGWENITIAFPFNVLEIPAVNKLLERNVAITLFAVNESAVERLNQELIAPVNVFIELDAGYPRSGIPTDSISEITQLALLIEKGAMTNFYGLYCHPGNTYQTNSVAEIKQIWTEGIKKVNTVKLNLGELGEGLKIRMGDTPGCTVVENFEGVDEIGPGNFVFYDLVMNYLNVCTEDEIAVAVACPVVGKSEERCEIIIHGGAVHFSKDHLFDEQERKFFGEVVILEEEGWSSIIEGIKLTSLSQEHGVLKATHEIFETIEVGDVLAILPIHSCLTANLMKSYLTFDGQVINHLEKL
uniref:alanine racemase n=1 Tax=Roseivirga sp. TaxID=1964215 RepID=UPI0040470B19